MKTRYLFLVLTISANHFASAAGPKTNVVNVVPKSPQQQQRSLTQGSKVVRPGQPSITVPPAPGAQVPSAPPAAAAIPVAPPAFPTTNQSSTNKTEEMIPVQLLQWENMPLGQALEIYSDLVNKTILRPANLPTTTFINLKIKGTLTKSDAITAIETVFAMNGFTVVPIGDKFVKVVQEAQAGTQGGEFFKGEAKDLPVAGRFVTQIIQLKYVPVQDAVAAITPFAKGIGGSIVPIQSNQTIVIRDYSENIKRIMEVIDKIDTVTPMEIKPEVIPIKYALASDIAQVIGSLTASGAGMTVGSRGKSGLSNTGVSGSIGGGAQLGQSGYPQGQTQTPGQSMLGSPATSGRSSFQSRLQNIVNRASASGDFQILGEAKIIADERTNSLLIFANDQDMVMIKTIISQLDVVLAQVLIESIIMDVELTDQFNAGVSYQQQPKSMGGGVKTAGGVYNPPAKISPAGFLNPAVSSLFAGNTNGSSAIIPSGLPSSGGFSYFATIGNSFDVAMQLSASDSRFHVLSRPRIQTSHAVEARLFDGQTIPYITGTSYGYNGSGNNSQYQQKEVGVALTVLPLINPDGLVVMDISQNIEDVTTTTKIDNNDVPITSKREALAKVAVRDRETIILGGFIRTKKTQSSSGVPYLKDLPGLGALFRTRSKQSDRSELMVFIRPTVLPTPEAAAAVATNERDKLPGVKQAEFEIREDERRRNEAIEADMRKKLGIKEPVKNGVQ